MILDDIVSKKKEQLKIQKMKKPLKEILNEIINEDARNFKAALDKDYISIIGEIKKASPSKGIIRENFNHLEIAKLYDDVNVDAISVLTEKNYFKGDDRYIKDVKKVTSKPILRKDFIFDEYQLYETKAIGADAVLLIVAILGKDLNRFYKKAKELNLYSIVEVHDEHELNIALDSNPEIIGINNRDLRDFHVDLNTTERLKKYIPSDVLVVSESGIKSPKVINYLHSIGVSAVLIGETFMRKIDKKEEIKEFIMLSKGV